MLNQDLLNYIRESLNQGFSKDEIRDTLLNVGWRMDDIAEVFGHIGASDNAQVVMNSLLFSKKKMAVLASVLAVFLFTGSSVFAGYYYYKTMPARTIQKMGDHMNEIKTFHYSANLNFSGRDADVKVDTEIKLGGAADILDENNIKSYSDITFSSKAFSNDNGASGNENNIFLGIFHKKIDNANYLKLEVLQEGNDEEILSFLKSAKIDGKWVEISAKDLEEFADVPPVGQSSGIESAGAEDPQPLPVDQLKTIEKLKDIFQKHELFDTNEYLGSETMQDGAETRHIKFTANKEELKKFLVEAAAELGNSVSQYGAEEDYKKELKESVGALEMAEGDIWVGKDDSFLHKIEIKVKMKDETSEGDFNFSLEFFDINKPVDVEVPADAMPIMDVLKNVLGN